MTHPKTGQQAALNAEFPLEVWDQESIQKLVGRAIATGKRYDREVMNPKLVEWAAWALMRYTGTFDLLLKFQRILQNGEELTNGQAAVVLNSLVRAFRNTLPPQITTDSMLDRSLENVAVDASDYEPRGEINPLDAKVDFSTVRSLPTVEVGIAPTIPHPGTYTVAFGSEHRTIRFKPTKDDGGRLVVEYLSGSDNENDYTSCGYLWADGRLQLWTLWYHGHRYDRGSFEPDRVLRNLVAQAIKYLVGLPVAEQLRAGEIWASASGRCFICKRTLTVPSSISQMMGPICAGKWTKFHATAK